MTEDEEWQHLSRTNWRGLGLADPIKNVEVRSSVSALARTLTASPTGQVAPVARIPRSQRSRQTAHRFVQLLCRYRHQEHRQSQQQDYLRCRPPVLAQIHRHSRWLPRPHRPRRYRQEYHPTRVSAARHNLQCAYPRHDPVYPWQERREEAKCQHRSSAHHAA